MSLSHCSTLHTLHTPTHQHAAAKLERAIQRKGCVTAAAAQSQWSTPARPNQRPGVKASSTAAPARHTAWTTQKSPEDAADQRQAHQQGPAEQPQAGQSAGTFVWTANWYPIAIIDDLRLDKPTATTVLGKDLVIWRDGDGQWHVQADQCPHRLAPLSEGDIIDGTLSCRYHGWRFDGGGTCVSLPQARSPKAEQAACANRLCKLATYPSQVAHGVLWVWPDMSPMAHDESSRTPVPWIPELDDPSYIGTDLSIGDLSAGWQVVTENSMDPCHANFVHEYVLGRREDAAPMDMRVDGEIRPDGFVVAHNGYTKQAQAENMRAVRIFTPPCTVKTDYQYDSGKRVVAGVYLVPMQPGKTRTISRFVFKPPPPPAAELAPAAAPKPSPFAKLAALRTPVASLKAFAAKQLKARLPKGFDHLAAHPVGDQDMLVLMNQERKLALHGRGWREYYRATPSDAGVTALYKWLEAYGGGGVPYDGAVAGVPPRPTREQMLEHYERHTALCRHCREALAWTDRTVDRLATALRVFSALAVLSAAASGPGRQLQVPLALSAAFVGLAGACWWAQRWLEAKRELFFRGKDVPQDHRDEM